MSFLIIRSCRGLSRHEGAESLNKAKLLFPQAYSLCEWFMQVYGDFKYVHRDYQLPEKQQQEKFIQSTQEKAEEERLRKQDKVKAQQAEPVAKAVRTKKNMQAANKRPKTEAETRCLIDEQL